MRSVTLWMIRYFLTNLNNSDEKKFNQIPGYTYGPLYNIICCFGTDICKDTPYFSRCGKIAPAQPQSCMGRRRMAAQGQKLQVHRWPLGKAPTSWLRKKPGPLAEYAPW